MSLSLSHNALGDRDWPPCLDVGRSAYQCRGSLFEMFKDVHCCEIWCENRREIFRFEERGQKDNGGLSVLASCWVDI